MRPEKTCRPGLASASDPRTSPKNPQRKPPGSPRCRIPCKVALLGWVKEESREQFTSLSDFKDHIRENVCQLGGDAAIASANGLDRYIKASVLKRVAGEPTAPVAAAAAPATKHGGCEFDTQCKGDRICVDGECEAPAKTPAPAQAAAASVPAAK
jgi:hypothetical protein